MHCVHGRDYKTSLPLSVSPVCVHSHAVISWSFLMPLYLSNFGVVCYVLYCSYYFEVRTSELCVNSKKVNASHTRYRLSGPELIPVYRQLARQ